MTCNFNVREHYGRVMRNTISHILVTGAHRSGTTWVGRTISQHPGIKYIHEPFNVRHPNREMDLKLNTWFTYAPKSNQKKDIKASFDRLLNSKPLHRAIWACKREGLDIKTPLRFFKHFLLGFHYRKFLIKDPLALLSAGWLHEMYDFKVICMIRNPVAFVGSLKKAVWDFNFENLKVQEDLMQECLSPFFDEVDKFCGQSGDFIDRACLLWNVLHFVILEYEKRYPSWLFVKHEDIAMSPISEFQKIFDYLELRMDSAIRAHIEEFTSNKNSVESESTKYRPRNAKKILGTWQERLSAQEIDRVRNATRNIATQFYGDSVYQCLAFGQKKLKH